MIFWKYINMSQVNSCEDAHHLTTALRSLLKGYYRPSRNHKAKPWLTGTRSGYFFLIFSPSARRFSNEFSVLYSHFIFSSWQGAEKYENYAKIVRFYRNIILVFVVLFTEKQMIDRITWEGLFIFIRKPWLPMKFEKWGVCGDLCQNWKANFEKWKS